MSNNSSGNRTAAEDLEEELRDLQAGEERGGSCASVATDRYLDAVAEQIFTKGAAHARQRLQVLHENLQKMRGSNTTCANARKRRSKE